MNDTKRESATGSQGEEVKRVVIQTLSLLNIREIIGPMPIVKSTEFVRIIQDLQEGEPVTIPDLFLVVRYLKDILTAQTKSLTQVTGSA